MGGISLTLKSIPEGMLAHMDADVSPRDFFLRFLSTLFGGEKILTQFWIDLFKQLTSVAESGCYLVVPKLINTKKTNLHDEEKRGL
jgi:hypothetical protein